ncbi:HEAT repeat domain-containing protein [Longimicrobium sp.]|uniref:HEAT repeat domain-containing protein n=1 Tax=Longimicrobium sp. TaxID=2029185 RepID=UPI002C7812E3|nr:HEAT repeat domain-containing protein [Longimicrobium sp.]HSU17340.1 HEAT repeat domain-containing protein [Longimicrobium sp.]
MSSIRLLDLALVVIGVAWIASLVTIFGHGVAMALHERRSAPLMERGRMALAGVAVQPRVDRADEAFLRALPLRLQIRLFTELAPSIGGAQRRHLSALAREVGLVEGAERLCKSRKWWKRLRGIRLLTALGGGEDVVPPLFRDPHPAVRAEAAEWAGQNPTPGVIRRLILLLEYPEAVGSWVLRDSLIRIGPPAIDPLAAYLETHGGEQAEAALEVATGLADPRFAAAAERLCGDADPVCRARAVALAGAIGGDALVRRAVGLLDDAEPSVRAAAAAALGRLGHWPAAARLARMLRDPAWVVRSQSALAMRRLGSPGQLLLRRALDDRDRFAADIARQVLDMPETTTERDQWR